MLGPAATAMSENSDDGDSDWKQERVGERTAARTPLESLRLAQVDEIVGTIIKPGSRNRNKGRNEGQDAVQDGEVVGIVNAEEDLSPLCDVFVFKRDLQVGGWVGS